MLNSIFSIVPSGETISMFGLTHLSSLFIGLIMAYFIIKRNKENDFLIKLSTIGMLLIFICFYAWYHFSPLNIFVKALPLYTCRLSAILLAIGIFCKHQSSLKLGSYWGLFGGFFGLICPTIYEYPFPHLLQIYNFYLHLYVFLVSTYYIFVKRIGMNKKETKSCCISTGIFLAVAHITNIMLGSNYSSTLSTPSGLLKLGITIPTSVCLTLTISSYLIAIVLQYKLIKKYEEIKEACNDTN